MVSNYSDQSTQLIHFIHDPIVVGTPAAALLDLLVDLLLGEDFRYLRAQYEGAVFIQIVVFLALIGHVTCRRELVHGIDERIIRVGIDCRHHCI